MEGKNQEKRRHKRIKLPYTMKFRSTTSKFSKDWNAVTPINMSASGICFFATDGFPEEAGIQFSISNPLDKGDLVFDCKVIRCKRSESRPVLFETAVKIETMSEQTKKVYTKLLEEFIKGKKENQGG